MSRATNELNLAYAEWNRLTRAQGAAIRSGNWSFVAECQGALAQLRQNIDRLNSGIAEQTVESDGGNNPNPQASRATILELIELQRRNLISLEQRRQRLSAHIENLSRASRNLRCLQRSYRAPTVEAWSSYS